MLKSEINTEMEKDNNQQEALKDEQLEEVTGGTITISGRKKIMEGTKDY